jgi:hypothetical protein
MEKMHANRPNLRLQVPSRGTQQLSRSCRRDQEKGSGIEPAFNSDATDFLPCGCVNCQQCRAARALHLGCPDWLYVASADADLQRVIAAWDALPQAIRAAVMAVIGTVAPRTDHSPLLAQQSRAGLGDTARRLARECREIVQGCLREEEWQDADQEFAKVIRAGLMAAKADVT